MSSDSSSTAPLPSTTPPRPFHYEYSILKGLFAQSEDSTDDTTFDFKTQNFGLIPRAYPTDPSNQDTTTQQWPRFTRYLHHLASTTQPGESYKLLFLARHGQGVHNVAESTYGTQAWDAHFSLLDGADGNHWADALLTPTGEQQARDVHALWEQLLGEGIPAPQRYYVSPLTRTIQTADLSFADLHLPADRPYRPIVKELLREALGMHTCDRRSPARHLRAAFPHLAFEDGFSDADALWVADVRETRAERAVRLRALLDDVFERDGGEVLSFTSHSGAIASLLEVLGHRAWALETGGVVPVVVRAVRVGVEV